MRYLANKYRILFWRLPEWLVKKIFHSYKQGRGAGVGDGSGRNRAFLAPWSRSQSRLKKTRSQSRLEKKSGAGAVAFKKLSGSSALLEDKKHKEIVLFLLLGKIVSLYG